MGMFCSECGFPFTSVADGEIPTGFCPSHGWQPIKFEKRKKLIL